MGESVQERCLIRGNPSNLPRAGGPILPQTTNVEQFGGGSPQSSPSSRQNSHPRQPWQGRKWPRWLPSSRQKTTRASPGKAVNGRDGSCRHHDNISNACPGEASNGKGISDHRVGRHYDNPPNASPGKASNGRRSRDHSHRDGSPSGGRMLKRLRQGADGHPSPPPLPTQLDEEDAYEHAPGHEIDAPTKIWPENMMEIIAVIVKSTSECPDPPLFKFEMNGAAAESNFSSSENSTST